MDIAGVRDGRWEAWFALQFQSDGGVEIQFTGYRGENDELAVKLGIEPEGLQAITEDEFEERRQVRSDGWVSRPSRFS